MYAAEEVVLVMDRNTCPPVVMVTTVAEVNIAI